MLTITGTTIKLTRGDSAHVEMPITNEDGTPYTVSDEDEVTLQVRPKAISNDADISEPVINGTIRIEDGSPIWDISSEDSEIDAGAYRWDIQITMANGDRSTFNGGSFVITPEVTI